MNEPKIKVIGNVVGGVKHKVERYTTQVGFHRPLSLE